MARNATSQILSPRVVEGMIANGHAIVIFEGKVLRLDSWMEKHPGGKLAIMHMVGRDATDEINVYHSAKTMRMMGAYRIGRIDEPWVQLTPPIRGGDYRRIIDGEAEEKTTSSSSEDDENSEGSTPASLNSSSTSLEVLETTVDDRGHKSQRSYSDSLRNDGKNIYNRKVARAKNNEKIGHYEPVTAEAIQAEIDSDLKDYPPIDAATQRNITLKYQALHQRVKDEGYYDCRYTEYGKELIRYVSIFALFIISLRAEWYMTSACFLGLFWHQIMFTAHDAGHRGITHNFIADTLIGMFVADFCCGLSIGWWKSSHNVHHLVTNQPNHDPDIQNTPLFATSPSFLTHLHSSYYDFTFAWDAACTFMLPYQKYTYYPIMAFARFNLYVLSWLHLLSPRSTNLGSASWTRPAEIAFMCGYWYFFGYCLLYRSIPTASLRVAFVFVSHLATFPLHIQITLSHWAMPTAHLGESESFPQRQLRTTMDVDCPAWLDFVHGGLQFQAVHHLFPRVPRHNLRKLQGLVREFCDETGIEYRCLGFVAGNKIVLGRLEEISKLVGMLVECQGHMARTGESGLK